MLRLERANAWVPASYDDGFDELVGLIFRTHDRFHLSGSIITGLSGVTSGTVYFLGEGGTVRDTAPSSGMVVVLGKGIDRETLLFDPGLPMPYTMYRAMVAETDPLATSTP